MNDILLTVLTGLGGAVVVPGVLYLWGIFLKRDSVRNYGRAAGRFASRLLNQRLGVKGGERIQDRIKSTLEDFMSGVIEGMDEDDAHAAH